MFSDRAIHTKRLARLAMFWMIGGSALLLLQALTPLTLFDPAWGKTPLFWLVLAPACVLAVQRPQWPLELLAEYLRRRDAR